jgi:hypothetical protein
VSVAAALRLPRRTSSAKEQQLQAEEFEFGQSAACAAADPAAPAPPATLHRSVTAPSALLSGTGRQPVGASLLVIPEPAGQRVPAAGGGSATADTPTLFGRQQQPNKQQSKQPQPVMQRGLQQHQAAMGLPPEAWSPINLQEVPAMPACDACLRCLPAC